LEWKIPGYRVDTIAITGGYWDGEEKAFSFFEKYLNNLTYSHSIGEFHSIVYQSWK
jgi:hypothetical protein